MSIEPKRKEIWFVNSDPTLGTEIKKIRPVIVISSDEVERLPLKLIAPITDRKNYFSRNLWHICIAPDHDNGLPKISAIDVLQIRGVDTQRFIRRVGQVSEEQMQEIGSAIAAVIEFQSE
ncbi:type II toxin-antitoxin system PemK/MazF family toxin [Cyanobacteria bacterium FACHB-63]|nr:type II toxin-antitoxin system PemK/MazF family toxin [Cyanobacteria bacterium FACHB-63]